MQRGEVWLINLDPTIGAELRKTRPAIIVNDDAVGILPLRIIVPVTEWKDRYAVAPWMVRLQPDEANGLAKLSAADAFKCAPWRRRDLSDVSGSCPIPR
jgi:mRNA interferase MazF